MILDDPLQLCNTENKSLELSSAINYLQSKKHVFRPTIFSNPLLLGGHG
jgi:hypothetical protein